MAPEAETLSHVFISPMFIQLYYSIFAINNFYYVNHISQTVLRHR